SLRITLGGREFREDAPVVYQLRGGEQVEIPARYQLAPDGALTFALGDYDRSRPLVIDPVVYSTLLGGASAEAAAALAVDASGSAYVAGFTASLNFPAINPA